MPTWVRIIAARLWAAWRVDALDRDFDHEVATHLAMAEADKIRSGMTPADARRAARVELGGAAIIATPFLGYALGDISHVRYLRQVVESIPVLVCRRLTLER